MLRSSKPRVNLPRVVAASEPRVVAATAEEAQLICEFQFLKGGAPPEGWNTLAVYKATTETYAYAKTRLREPPPPPLPRRSGKKRRTAGPVEDAPLSPSADLSHLRAIGANESTWQESVRQSAMESWRELQRDASYHTPFPSSSRFPPISRSRLTVQSEPNIPMAVFSLGRGTPPRRYATHTRGELHWSPVAR